MNLTRFILNIKPLNIYSQYEIYKAKKLHLSNHNECAVCGNKKYLEVHHVLPQHLYPQLACKPNNLITLCDCGNNACHRHLGHFGNFKSKWNENIREVAIAVRLISNKDDKHTEQLINEFASFNWMSNPAYIKHVHKLISWFS